jgi:hypothetical protein
LPRAISRTEQPSHVVSLTSNAAASACPGRASIARMKLAAGAAAAKIPTMKMKMEMTKRAAAAPRPHVF